MITDLKYNSAQLKQLDMGEKSKIDISVYENPDFNAEQMSIIRQGLIKGLDVSIYAKVEYTWQQMFYIMNRMV